MKRCVCLVFSFLLILGFAAPARADTPYEPTYTVESAYAYLYNMDSGKAIYEKNSEEPCFPASLTMIMTCILALENTPDLQHTIVTYPTYIQEYLYNYQRNLGANINLAGLMAGEQLTMEDLVYGMMLRSGNEIAMIIADHIGSGRDMERQEDFVRMMNQRARQLGATSTNFTNANGLHDPKQTTTAKDIALITMHALNLPGFEKIVNTTGYVAGPTNMHDKLEWSNANHMLLSSSEYYYPYLSGVKGGTLPESGRCLVTTAQKDGFTYLLVLMGAPYLDSSQAVISRRADYSDTLGIYNWVFDAFKVKSLVEQNRIMTEVPLRLNSDKDFLQVCTRERFTALVPADVDPVNSVSKVYDLPDSVDAPVEKGEHIGWVSLVLYGEELGRVELVAYESVQASRFLVILEQVSGAVSSFWFKFAVIFVILLIIFYIFLMIMRNRNRRLRSTYKPRRRL